MENSRWVIDRLRGDTKKNNENHHDFKYLTNKNIILKPVEKCINLDWSIFFFSFDLNRKRCLQRLQARHVTDTYITL